MKKYLTGVFVCFTILPAVAQDRLADYIRIGLANNQVLKEKKISIEQSLLSLKNARSYFLPSVNFITDYLSGEGGRTFAFPAGDLLNSVYTTLNQLTSTQKFPQVNNADAHLLPNNFYDARFRITYPLLNRDIYYNREISRNETVMKEYEVDIYRLELIRDIKQAYFNYCSSINRLNIYNDALTLVKQNLTVTQSLLKNGKSLPANILRVESELQNITAKIIESDNGRVNARNYLNFLINRPLTDSVLFTEPQAYDSLANEPITISEIQERAELQRINTGIKLYNARLEFNRSYYLPKLSTYLDFGSQASDFKFNTASRYYLFGAQLNIPLFNGERNQNNIKQAKLDLESLHLQKDLLISQLQMSVATAQNNVASASAACKAAEKQLLSAKAYFNLIDKGFREGANSLIEFIDARNQLTTASLQLNINQYNLFLQMAEYERQTKVSKIK